MTNEERFAIYNYTATDNGTLMTILVNIDAIADGATVDEFISENFADLEQRGYTDIAWPFGVHCPDFFISDY